MNTKPVFLAILAVFLAFCLAFVGCDDGNGGGRGGLKGQTFTDGYGTTLIFSDSDFTMKDAYEELIKGTYTESNGIVTCTITWMHPFVTFPGISVGDTLTMTLSGNTLTDEDGDTWTKQGGGGK